MSQARIKALIEDRLRAWAQPNDYPVQFENERFEPPNKPRAEDNLYLQCYVLPSRTTSIDLAGDHRGYRGVGQVNVVGPKGLGKGFAAPIIERLDDLFPVNLVLTDSSGFKFQIISPLSEAPGLSSATTYTIPTSFNYRSDVI